MADIIKSNDPEGQLKVEEVGSAGARSYLPSSGVIQKGGLTAAGQAELIVREAREAAAQIRAQAKKLLENMETQVSQKKQQGLEQGRQEGLARVTELVTAAETHREKLLQDAEPEFLRMVMQIVEKILGDAVAEGQVVAVVKRALTEAIGERVTVRVHPKDLEKVRTAEPQLKEAIQGLKSLTTVADEEIEAGGCAVDTEVGTIDAQLSTQIAAIKKSLGLTE